MPPAPEAPDRHDLLTVEPGAWAAALAARPDLAGVPHLPDWAARGWPVIVRRRHPGEAADHLPIGLPLPPALGKRRIGLALPSNAATARPPLALAEARAAAPATWHDTIDALVGLGRAHGAEPAVFGGLLWQAATGLSYLAETSDLDLLWCWDGPVPRAFLDALAAQDAAAPMRLDGEVLLPDGSGINWRELHGAAPGDTVLAKRLDRLDLVAVERVRAG
ncbi:malonate decarboxylase holo-[acyl-carrier-protein] synthase [Methylobacterium sp. A54F]